jgi:hypothetical protein
MSLKMKVMEEKLYEEHVQNVVHPHPQRMVVQACEKLSIVGLIVDENVVIASLRGS